MPRSAEVTEELMRRSVKEVIEKTEAAPYADGLAARLDLDADALTAAFEGLFANWLRSDPDKDPSRLLMFGFVWGVEVAAVMFGGEGGDANATRTD